jgi:hypothetical protein
MHRATRGLPAYSDVMGLGLSRSCAVCVISVDLSSPVVQLRARRRQAARPRRGSSVRTDAKASTQVVVVVADDPASTERSLCARAPSARFAVRARNTGAARPMTDTVSSQSVHGPLSVRVRMPRPSSRPVDVRRPR